MKLLRLKFWQLLGLISGTIIAGVMALASISYNATLGTLEPAFALLPITNREMFSSLALAFDLGMVASVFGFWYWRASNRVAAAICAILFVIASLFSIHSVRGYIALNITKSHAPMERNKDVYASLKQELSEAQNHLGALRTSLLKTKSRRRTRRQREIARQVILVREVRARLASSQPSASVTPLAGLEWFLALTLWFFNATCWTAWFGTAAGATKKEAPQANLKLLPAKLSAGLNHRTQDGSQTHNHDSVRGWLASYRQNEPEHCAILYLYYCSWCEENSYQSLKERNFYTRLGDLGTRKFRDGRNGPTLYELPQGLIANSDEEAE